MYEDASEVFDDTPNAEEWQRLEGVFKDGPAREVILALKRTDNSPQDVASFGTKMRPGSLGGMNSSLLRKEIPFRLELVYEEGLLGRTRST
jgi:hypothetical protein